MTDPDPNLPPPWELCYDAEFGFDSSDSFKFRDDAPPPSSSSGEAFGDRVAAAALTAWVSFPSGSSSVSGEKAYADLMDLYFALQKTLFPYSRRKAFTKGECILLMDSLAPSSTTTRDHRKSAEALNKLLKEALVSLPIVSFGSLQEAAKSCAMRSNDARPS
jgi:hypothetical protein